MTLKVEFSKDLEIKFRELAMKKYGFSKGSIKKASMDAIEKWVKIEEKTLPNLENPLNEIKGIMKKLKGKYTSVDLQHETSKIWTKKYS